LFTKNPTWTNPGLHGEKPWHSQKGCNRRLEKPALLEASPNIRTINFRVRLASLVAGRTEIQF
jgi:hypothetical protein